MSDNKYGDQPLGKSVEEIESESGNTVNSPVPGEQRRAEEDRIIPAIVPGTAGGTPAVVNIAPLVDEAVVSEDEEGRGRSDG